MWSRAFVPILSLKTFKAFNERIGTKALDQNKSYIRASLPQPGNAFNTLKNTYDLSHKGSDNATEIFHMIDADFFNYQLAHQYENLAIRANDVLLHHQSIWVECWTFKGVCSRCRWSSSQ